MYNIWMVPFNMLPVGPWVAALGPLGKTPTMLQHEMWLHVISEAGPRASQRSPCARSSSASDFEVSHLANVVTVNDGQ